MTPGKQLRIFLVDDSQALVDAIRDLLSEIPGVLIVGSSGQPLPAIAEISRLTPDVVVLDLQLDGGSGLDVLRYFKAAGKKLPLVIVFSSSVDGGYGQASRRLGAEYVFDKATDYGLLTEVVRRLASEMQRNSA